MKTMTILALCSAFSLPTHAAVAADDSEMDFSQEVSNNLKKQIEANPKNGELYFKLAQEYFSYNNPKEGFAAMEQAIKLTPKAEYYFAISKVYAEADQPNKAFEALNNAVKLAPNKKEYWRNRGIIADWLQNPVAMQESYQHAHDLDPNDAESSKGLADANKQVENAAAKKVKVTKKVVTTKKHSHKATHNKVAAEKKTLSQHENTPIVTLPPSTITIGEQGFHDTHTVSVYETGLSGYVYFTPTTAVHFGALYEYAHATDILYTPIDGGTRINDISGKIGLQHQYNPCLNLEANIGLAAIHDASDQGIYDFTARYTPSEHFWVSYHFSHDIYRPDYATVSSPRSISLGIMEDENRINFHAEPIHNAYWDILLEYNSLSDGNHLWHENVWPNARVLELSGLTMNLGFSADWYSFEYVLPQNGYYSPRLAQVYLGTISFHHDFTSDTGISLNGGLGIQKDETLDHFRLAADIGLDATLCVIANWQLELIAGYSYRDNPDPSSPYEIWSGRIAFTRQF
ncbi:MAG: hypothetical protein M3R00_05385 [Pseudomonadota bacterium]|nr:hypothetical protein [Pseudomonadota bacterium]